MNFGRVELNRMTADSRMTFVAKEDEPNISHSTGAGNDQAKPENFYSFSSCLLVCVAVVFLHILALLFTLQHKDAYGRQDEWLLQNIVLIASSCVASIAFCFSRGRWAIRTCPLIILCYAIVSYSNGTFIYQDLLLVESLGCLVGLFLPARTSKVLGMLMIPVVLIAKWPKLFTGILLPANLLLLIALIISTELLFVFLSSMVRKLHMQYYQQCQTNDRLNNAVVRLTSANLGFQQHAFVMEEESAENERKRISRDIHDTVGYVMTNIIMMMEEADSLLDNSQTRVRQLIRATQTQAQTGWNEAHMALSKLRIMPSDDDNWIGTIQQLVNFFSKATGIKIKLEWGNIPMHFTEEIESVVYRFIQEGLTNSFRHGKASAVVISFWMTEQELLVSLRDNGVGATEFTEGIGMNGIRERLKPVGGTLAAHNIVDGFELLIHIPYNAGNG
ncbi:MAG: hypothetical protein SAMD01599839_00950 [Rectinema sp.]